MSLGRAQRGPKRKLKQKMLYEKITKFLKENNIEYQEIRHEAVRTSEEACKIRGCKPEEGAKALVFFADKNPIQIIIEGNKKIDKKKFKNDFGFKDLQMVSRDELIKISSVEPGAVPPFGNLFETPLKIFCNKTLVENEYIEFNAGDHTISIRMKAKDWEKIINPILGDFAEVENLETSTDKKNSKAKTLLAIDYGTKKIGLALYKNELAVPLKVLDNKPNSGTETEALNEIVRHINEENVSAIIMGIPLVDGKENKETQKIRVFGNKLKKIVHKQIHYIDESKSTLESTQKLLEFGVPKNQRQNDDGFSALIILQRFLAL